MNTYKIIANTIEYIAASERRQPELEELATHAGMSPTKLQKTFTDYVGVSPKQFARYLTVEHAKGLLKEHSNMQAAYKVGLSGTGRLHDLFVDLEAMTPGEFKNGGAELIIHYSLHDSVFGKYVVASTCKGVCNILFYDTEDPTELLRERWPQATLIYEAVSLQQPVVDFFKRESPEKIKLHVKGTNFQVKIWEALLKVPEGALMSYGTIAKHIGDPKASRAVGTAIGANPIGYLIPCHRAIKATGHLGKYHWGDTRKKVMVGCEQGWIDNSLNEK